MVPGHDETTEAAFTAQAAGFNSSPAQNAPAILDAMVALAAPAPDQRWLDAACGPGIVSRALAPHVKSVLGIDLTPAMIDLARAEAARLGIANATFEVGDATALTALRVDGAITRYSLHHVPRPGRLLDQLARIVHPGGRVVVADHLADSDRDAFAWTSEVERVRDPSHWASLTADGIRRLAADHGLGLADERIVPLTLDFDEWLHRGTEDPSAHDLVEQLLDDRPGGTDHFAVDTAADGGRTLTLQLWLGALRA